MSTLLKIEFQVNAEQADICSTFLSPKVPHGWEETPLGQDAMLFRIFLEDHPLGMELMREIEARFPECGIRYAEQEAEQWAMAWKDFFNPIACGERFEILPPWMSGEGHDGMTHIVIEPKMAFGTGHHPTTSLCLETIGDVAKRGIIKKGMEFLDLGTGSGILGIGLCKLGLNGIGLDIDPQAIPCAQENLEINHVDDSMKLAVGTIDSLRPDHVFDLVVANILSGPLIEMAGDILAHVKPGGVLVLSGILNEQAKAVAAAYDRRGIGMPEITAQGEWVVLVWDKVEK
ncbi:50S ribosomal protein L11 methyltransferase [Salidesulfovibrio onnuriiensis]|uniref:50S ribosomal protein L11 methyltransferase n=1 Tax=Salidesulfovibrio onnuriiensis TaxID=2583823 RepID=UPI0011CC3772|nr:50S ribosomal protein L11 methyltransferase [Salidesulfovibrio onnuriiensis]